MGVSQFQLLVLLAVTLVLAWAFLGAFLLADRLLHDRGRARAAQDAAELAGDPDTARLLSRRRLRRLALGPPCEGAAVAARVLVRRRRASLRAAAERPRPPAARLHALTILVRGGDLRARRLLAAAVAGNDRAMTSALLRLAAELPETEGDELLLDVLVSGRHPRSRTATELEPRATRLRDELVELASVDDPELRYWAVSLLRASMDDPDVVDAVGRCAFDDHANVRAAAAEALGRAPATVARPLLRLLLRDDLFYVRAHAARAVAEAGREELAEELLPLLADGNWWVRAAAKESLAALGDSGLAVAVAALSHPDRFARDGALEVIGASGRLVDAGVAEVA